MPAEQQCLNCSERGIYLETITCGYCGLDCCEYCINQHEEDCDQNPENKEEE